MKNNLINIKTAYNLIRDEYVFNFPYELEFEALKVLNNFIKNENKDAFLRKNDDGTYHFENPHPTVRDDSPFENSFGASAIKVEEYLSQADAASNIIKDINALHNWLCKSDFIREGVATEKMLNIYTLM
jgi:hypothetical protein